VREEAAIVRAKHAANIPVGRMARPEEIGAAMLFLSSKDSSFVAGSDCWSTAACAPPQSDRAVAPRSAQLDRRAALPTGPSGHSHLARRIQMPPTKQAPWQPWIFQSTAA
jgi:hypothetical protein